MNLVGGKNQGVPASRVYNLNSVTTCAMNKPLVVEKNPMSRRIVKTLWNGTQADVFAFET